MSTAPVTTTDPVVEPARSGGRTAPRRGRWATGLVLAVSPPSRRCWGCSA